MPDVSVTLAPGQEFPVSVTDQLQQSSLAAPLTSLTVQVAATASISATVSSPTSQTVTVQGASGGGGANYDQSLKTTDSVQFAAVSISGGAAQIHSDGTASFYGMASDGHVVTMGDAAGTIKAGNLYGAPSFELWNGAGRAAYFYAGEGDCGIFDARSVSTNFGMKITPDVSVAFGNYFSTVVSIYADGSIGINGGTLSSDGTDLFWNGSKINP
jgi:hypothetical protein